MFPQSAVSFKVPMTDPIMGEYGEAHSFQPSVPRNKERKPTSIQKIDQLDFSQVKMKLCLPIEQEGKGWTVQEADECEEYYKQFLKLMTLYPGKNIVPTKTIDAMWHAHILDTHKYHDDCQQIFGSYLHHFPYFGLRGEEDAQNLQKAFAGTLSLFEEHFGKAPIGSGHSDCDSCGGSQCGQTS